MASLKSISDSSNTFNMVEVFQKGGTVNINGWNNVEEIMKQEQISDRGEKQPSEVFKNKK
jgi:hypothetical protein